jgi:hypothetical protein
VGVSRIEGPIFINVDQSYVLSRPASKGAEEGGSVVQRPYRSAPGEAMLRDATWKS